MCKNGLKVTVLSQKDICRNECKAFSSSNKEHLPYILHRSKGKITGESKKRNAIEMKVWWFWDSETERHAVASKLDELTQFILITCYYSCQLSLDNLVAWCELQDPSQVKNIHILVTTPGFYPVRGRGGGGSFPPKRSSFLMPIQHILTYRSNTPSVQRHEHLRLLPHKLTNSSVLPRLFKDSVPLSLPI